MSAADEAVSDENEMSLSDETGKMNAAVQTTGSCHAEPNEQNVCYITIQRACTERLLNLYQLHAS